MITIKSPFRISFFGGSTDYKDFYEQHGSFVIGTTIDKNVYITMRKRPVILSSESVITYSKLQHVKTFDEIDNPLIKSILKYTNVSIPIELNSFSDIPSRTGLGGSSSFSVGLLYLINKLLNKDATYSKKDLVKDAIKIERFILNESGGIQDQIWPVYGGFNTIEITKEGKFFVKPLSITEEFKTELQSSILLIYTNYQRNQDDISKSHENKNKLSILDIAKQAHSNFLQEDIKSIGELLYQSWIEKRNISSLISTQKIDDTIKTVMSMGAYGAKLLGSGGCGFILVICNPIVKQKITELFKNDILDVKFTNDGVKEIFST